MHGWKGWKLFVANLPFDSAKWMSWRIPTLNWTRISNRLIGRSHQFTKEWLRNKIQVLKILMKPKLKQKTTGYVPICPTSLFNQEPPVETHNEENWLSKTQSPGRHSVLRRRWSLRRWTGRQWNWSVKRENRKICKIWVSYQIQRVMESGFFVLMRFWLRVDGVIFRLHETRVYHQFGTNFILREYQRKESTYKSISQMLPPDPAKYNDPNFMSSLLNVKELVTEELSLEWTPTTIIKKISFDC